MTLDEKIAVMQTCKRGKNIWVCWLKWLFTLEPTNKNKTSYHIKD